MYIAGVPDCTLVAIVQWRSWGFMVFVQQHISSLSTGLLFHMIHQPCFEIPEHSLVWHAHQVSNPHICWTRTSPFDRATSFSWPPDQKSIWSHEHLTVTFSDQKLFQTTHPGSIRNFSGKSIWRPNFTPIHPPPEKNRQNTPVTHIFQKTTHRTPFWPPNLPPYFTPTNTPYTRPIPNLYHTWSITGHIGGHTVLVIKAGSHFRIQSRMQSCIKSCTVVKKIFLLCQLTYPLFLSQCIQHLS